MHEWGVLGTASAAFSHTEGGAKFHGLRFKAEGQEALTARYSDILTSRWAICVYVCGCVHLLLWPCIPQPACINPYQHHRPNSQLA